ncbi:uncharacterized protein [Coffea arabica]|uniref:RNA-binding protein 42-like n=1 Tax=Coffea arabica TaxID=13443 RepID=A0A6P6U0A5_COFAR|nr:uncharacterized protein LOC113705776 [Coffea arabica]XP_027093588.1 uncharacterized protein LOC113713989 [Coffea arabica]
MSSTSAAAASSSSSTASSQFTYTTGTYFPTPFHLQQPQTYVAAAPAASILQFPALPPAVPHVYPAPATVPTVSRKAAGQAWEDPTLADWPENDSRLFCGDLGNEVNDDVLSKAFSRFPSFNMARAPVSDWEYNATLPKTASMIDLASKIMMTCLALT